MEKRKLCVITGTRADYGLLFWLMRKISESGDFELQIVATGMHLSPEFGLTYQKIEQDGFTIHEMVEMLLSSDTPSAITKSVGLATISFADVYARLKPHLTIILGDRFEMLAAAQAALIAKIPIAHIGGGDTTEGAIDEAIRHSITKMSHLHFVTNDQSAARVIQMGESPKHVFNVGSPGVEYIKKAKLLSRAELAQQLNFNFREKNVLVTFHPSTLEEEKPELQFQKLLDALDTFGESMGIIITKPNADTDGRSLIGMIDKYVSNKPNANAYTSLGQLRYLSAIAQVDVVIGNSSSGLYEVPSFGKPTVNIGERQKGRLQAQSIINCEPTFESIKEGISQALVMDCSQVTNPYGRGETSCEIVKVLRDYSDYTGLLKKSFFSLEVAP